MANVATSLDAPIPGYGVEEFQWEVQAFVDGPKMNISGTIEQVYSKLLKLNPDWDEHFMNATNVNNQPTDDEKRSLQARFGPVCGNGGQPWGAGIQDYIIRGIAYLRGVAGQPTNGPGPGNCGRVSCSYSSAIWWCNDNTQTFSLPSFSTIADCAQVLVNSCSYALDTGLDPPVPVIYTLGQNFNGYNWNCIVRDGDGC
ncbi:hypothetical protein GGI35DRAFT_486226 [Trichoderma velutinum]